jgi:tetratricopeptide (TPR) repeat protein
LSELQSTIDSLWDWDDPAGSESRLRAAADSASGVERDILLTQVARARGLAGDFSGASDLLAALPADAPEIRVRALLERGRVLNSSVDPAAARPLFEAAFEAATEAGFEFLAIDALHMVAIVAAAAEQDELNRRALGLASSAADARARQWRASLLNNLGWSAFERGALEGALRHFEEAVAEREAQGKQGELLVARWCVARTLREMGRVPEALAIQQELAAAHRAAGTSDPFVDEELALLQTSTTPDPGSG